MKNIKLSKDIILLLISSFISLIIYQSVITAILIPTLLGIFFYRLLRKKPEHKVYVQLFAILFTISILVAPFVKAAKSDSEYRAEKQEVESGTSSTYQYLTEENSIERDIELVVIKVIGTDVKIEAISLSDTELVLHYEVADSITTNLIKVSMNNNMVDITKALSGILPETVNEIIFTPKMYLVDTYGNESLEKVGLITIKRNTWEKINWNNFYGFDLPDAADSYVLYPVLN